MRLTISFLRAGEGSGRGIVASWPRSSLPDAAALLREVDWVPLASVAAHVRESTRATVVLALAGPESRALRGEEAVVLASFDVCLGGECQVAACAWRGESGGSEGCDDESELHGSCRRVPASAVR